MLIRAATMTPTTKTAGKDLQAKTLHDARQAVQALRDICRFQTSLISRLEKAIQSLDKAPLPRQATI